MRRFLPIFSNEEFNSLLNKYEDAVANNAHAYFDIDELELIIDYYLQKANTKSSAEAIELGISVIHGPFGFLRRHPALKILRTQTELGGIVEAFDIGGLPNGF